MYCPVTIGEQEYCTVAEALKETLDRAVRIHIRSVQYDYKESLSDRIAQLEGKIRKSLEDAQAEGLSEAEEIHEDLYNEESCGDAGDPYEIVTDGRLRMRGSLCELSYLERDEDGMENTKTTLVFSKKTPNELTLTRSGVMRMTLSFEEGRHHIGHYSFGAVQSLLSDRPTVMISSYTRKLRNRITEDGTLSLDYIIEVRGMDTQRTVFSLSVSDISLAPKGLSDQGDMLI